MLAYDSNVWSHQICAFNGHHIVKNFGFAANTLQRFLSYDEKKSIIRRIVNKKGIEIYEKKNA